ncbi:MAG: hypothetical protein R2763_01460 [Mycobacterium sp.]
MANCHIAYHGYRHEPAPDEVNARLTIFTAGLSAVPCAGAAFADRHAGNPADAPRSQIPAIAAQPRAMHERIEKTDWARWPAGTVSFSLMMFGDHD